jgi:hypothetical protein
MAGACCHPIYAEELFMTRAPYEGFEALNPFFGVVMEGLRGLVDGDHFFDTIAKDALFRVPLPLPRLASHNSRVARM